MLFRSLALDLHAQWRGFETDGQWRFTPPTHAVLALVAALDELSAEGGVPARRRRCTALCEQLRVGMRTLGLLPLLDADVQAPVIVTFRMPPPSTGFCFEAFYAGLAERGYLVYPGKLTVAPSFRVGCIGHLDREDMQGFLGAAREVLAQMGVVL